MTESPYTSMRTESEELAHLRRELARVTQERDRALGAAPPNARRDSWRVLFFDIDGVLNCYDWLRRSGRRSFDPPHWSDEALTRLRTVVDRTGCRLVCSSSWRPNPALPDTFEDPDWRAATTRLADFGLCVDDVVPYLSATDQNRSRALEIKAWLARRPVDAYAIVDDDCVPGRRDDFDLLPYFVMTSMEYGLLDHHVAALTTILNAPRTTGERP